MPSGWEETCRQLAIGAPLRDELRAAGCSLYSHHVQPPEPEPERKSIVENGKAGIRARAGKRPGRPRVNAETEEAVRAALATGKGIRATARACGVGTSVVQRVRAG